MFAMDLCSPQGAEIMDDLKQRDQVPEWNDPETMIFRHLGGPSKSRMENRLPRLTLKAGRRAGCKAGQAQFDTGAAGCGGYSGFWLEPDIFSSR